MSRTKNMKCLLSFEFDIKTAQVRHSDMKIFSVIVIYNQEILHSKTFKSLMDAIVKCDCDKMFSLTIYDNSPLPQCIDWSSIPISIEYVHNSSNVGLAKAYNYALDTAVTNGFEWLLLLDQDTSLPDNFTADLFKTIEKISSDEYVVAVVPRVKCLGKIVSPSIIKTGGYFRPVGINYTGICHRPVTSINSGTLLRTSFMQSVGGFNTLFWLDYLDHWLFSTIYFNNKKVFISESVVNHELSVMDYGSWINVDRYENILKAEMLFLKVCRPKHEKFFYMLRLLKRMKDQLLDSNRSVFLMYTIRAFRSILCDDQYKG